MTNQQPIRVNMIVFPAMTQLDFTGPYEVFARMPDTRVDVRARTLEPVRSDLLLTRVGKPAAACLFIDDTCQNIEAANRLGFPTIWYQSPGSSRRHSISTSCCSRRTDRPHHILFGGRDRNAR